MLVLDVARTFKARGENFLSEALECRITKCLRSALRELDRMVICDLPTLSLLAGGTVIPALVARLDSERQGSQAARHCKTLFDRRLRRHRNQTATSPKTTLDPQPRHQVTCSRLSRSPANCWLNTLDLFDCLGRKQPIADRTKALGSGYDDPLTKPASFDVLEETCVQVRAREDLTACTNAPATTTLLRVKPNTTTGDLRVTTEHLLRELTAIRQVLPTTMKRLRSP